MPHYVDFSKMKDVKSIIVEPEGWINPLNIKYAITLRGDTPCYFWSIKGTSHTFVIPVVRMSFLTSGDFKKHFEEVLEKFRIDYLNWKKQDFYSDWMKEYKDQYEKFILT